jgi:flavin reductase (DIM6/NTAB) family NADH-FMN oxidoreductase RutF
VTIVTSGSDQRRTGLTVSSLLVVEGEPPIALVVAGPTTDLWEITAGTGRFIVHVCRLGQQRLADVFAGLAPSPGGVFASVETTDSPWGPVLGALPDRLYCSLAAREEVGWSGLIRGIVDRVEISDLTDPLVHFRSVYHRLAERV